MVGIDYSVAQINVRQCFAFTKTEIVHAMEMIKQNKNIKGCVILSTCNRMELWISLREGATLDLPEYLCSLKELDINLYRKFLKVREEEDAITHLFLLSAGMKSQIIGEDQILTQVKEAAAFAREQQCMDKVLEVLFRMAVTAGKQVKTEIPMDKTNFSAAHQAIQFLTEQGRELYGKKALVIGNGEMGKITAQALMEEGVDVTVTVRQYRSGVVKIPIGAKRINYGERYNYIPECDFVFSATASPNLTITEQGLQNCPVKKHQVYIDLAVPRDIEESIREMEQINLYDMDSLPVDKQSEQMNEQYLQARQMIDKSVKGFYSWKESRDLIPRIHQIGSASGKEFSWRLGKELKSLAISEEEKEVLRGQMEQTAEKVVDRLLFALRDQLDTDSLRQCVEVLEGIYESERETE